MNRSDFLRKSSLLAAGGFFGGAGMIRSAYSVYGGSSRYGKPAVEHPEVLSVMEGQDRNKVTILYTNDTHARIDPLPSNAFEHAGLGGISRRAELIRQIRSQSPWTLLLDAGDLFEDSAWFRLLGASKMMQLMSMMGYDAMCVGDQELHLGMDVLAEAADSADFPLLCANYRVTGTPLESIIRQSVIRETGGIRFGIFGLGIRLSGRMEPQLHKGILYGDPVHWAGNMVRHLRERYHCDYVICLSHLGFQYEDERMDDITLASQVGGIDLIIGGHTHTFLDEPVVVESPGGGVTMVTQAGHSGVRLGRIDLTRNIDGQIRELPFRSYKVGGQKEETE